MMWRALLLGLALLAACGSAQAGAQREPDLSAAMRAALSGQIAEGLAQTPQFSDPARLVGYLMWVAAESARLRQRIPDRLVRENLLQTIWYEATRAGLEPALVLGLIQVESGFNKYAISRAGAIGLMQVMPFWTHLLGSGNPEQLLRMRVNLRYGCVILRHYIDQEHGNLFYALGRYNGSRGQSAYPDAVLSARRRWEVPARELQLAGR